MSTPTLATPITISPVAATVDARGQAAVIGKTPDGLPLIVLPTPGAGQGCHQALLGAANRCRRLSLTRHEALGAIRAAIPLGERVVADREITSAIDKAYADTNWRRQDVVDYIIPNAKDRIEGIINSAGEIMPHELKSPVLIPADPVQQAVLFLTTLYDNDDYVVIDGPMGLRPPINAHMAAKQILEANIVGFPHIVINPLLKDGMDIEDIDGNKRKTYRSDICVVKYKYCLVELDNLPLDRQVQFWAASGMPIVALIYSGGKSIHCWLKVGVNTAEEYTALVEQGLYRKRLKAIKEVLGIDLGCANEARLSRMPGFIRDGKCQQLYYLNPEGTALDITGKNKDTLGLLESFDRIFSPPKPVVNLNNPRYGYTASDLGIAMLYLDSADWCLRYDPAEKIFYIFDPGTGRFHELEDCSVAGLIAKPEENGGFVATGLNNLMREEQLALQVLINVGSTVNLNPNSDNDSNQEETRNAAIKQHKANIKNIDNWIKYLTNGKLLMGVVGYIKTISSIQLDQNQMDNPPPHMFPVANGIIDLKNQTIRPYIITDYICKRYSQAIYDPKAIAPRWGSFISELTMDENHVNRPEYADYLQKLFGWCLTGNTSDQSVYMWSGRGGEGKGRAAYVLSLLLGNFYLPAASSFLQATTTTTNAENPTAMMAALRGKRALVVEEMKRNERLDEEKIKLLSGGNHITARIPYSRRPISFDMQAKVIMVMNEYPFTSVGVDMRRRLKVLKFDRPPVEHVDTHLDVKFAGELSGILNWALAGLANAGGYEQAAENLATNIPGIVREATTDIFATCDIIQQFLDEVVVKSHTHMVKCSHLLQLYLIWSKEGGDKFSYNRRTFAIEIKKRGYKRTTVHGIEYYLGIKLIAET